MGHSLPGPRGPSQWPVPGQNGGHASQQVPDIPETVTPSFSCMLSSPPKPLLEQTQTASSCFPGLGHEDWPCPVWGLLADGHRAAWNLGIKCFVLLVAGVNHASFWDNSAGRLCLQGFCTRGRRGLACEVRTWRPPGPCCSAEGTEEGRRIQALLTELAAGLSCHKRWSLSQAAHGLCPCRKTGGS